MDQNVKLEDIWKVELEILDEVDRVCTENGLKYSLAYGTLLGAIRHQGFIPWDDDIDIMMPREDYEQLRSIWNEKAKDGFIIQDETMYDDYVNIFAKVRKDHTTFIQFESERTCSYHVGVFIDIFPCDRVAPKGIKRKIQYAEFALSLIYNRGYTSSAKGIREAAEKTLLKIVPKRSYRRISNYLLQRSRRWNSDVNAQIVSPADSTSLVRYYPKDLFENLTRVLFQDKKYPVFSCYDDVLKLRYGDYMQLPPETERVWKHHPIIVDLDKNYNELDGRSNQGLLR